jgi:DNA polymerase-3 subunit epsilon
LTSWREASFAVVDVENTGLDPRVHEVLSVGVVPVENGRAVLGGAYYETARPATGPEADSVVIHGIRPVDAAAGGPADEVGARLVERLRGRILVAHVARVERGFLGPWLGPLGWRPEGVVDTDVLARLLILRGGGPLLRGHVALGAAADWFGLPEHERHHAMGDALTTAQLFLAAATLLVPGRDASVRDLVGAGRWLARAQRRHAFASAARRAAPGRVRR